MTNSFVDNYSISLNAPYVVKDIVAKYSNKTKNIQYKYNSYILKI